MIQADKAYFRAANALNFLKKLMSITGMSEQWVAAQIKQKGDSKCISWKSLRDVIFAYLDMKSLRLCLEYLRVGHFPQSTMAHR
ncbi:hypothetical protein Gotur_031635 [Gossypium turneri]